MPSRPVPSLLRGFSAPVNVTLDLRDDDAEFLMAHDSDLFNRWQAANTYAARTLVEAVAGLTSGKESNRGLRYARALGSALEGDGLEAAYRAELLKLPTQADVARIIGRNVDPALVHRAHRALMKLDRQDARAPARGSLRGDGRDRTVLARRAERRPPRPAQRRADPARRRAARPPTSPAWPSTTRTATNMTDRAHALFLLAYRGGAEAQAARWPTSTIPGRADNVVIDTWFAAQAQSPLAGTLGRVKALTSHPLFSLTAPNKVRALVGTFASTNPAAVQSSRRRRLCLPRRPGAGA